MGFTVLSIHHAPVAFDFFASALRADRLFAFFKNAKDSSAPAFWIWAGENFFAFCALENDGFAGKRRAVGRNHFWRFHIFQSPLQFDYNSYDMTRNVIGAKLNNECAASVAGGIFEECLGIMPTKVLLFN